MQKLTAHLCVMLNVVRVPATSAVCRLFTCCLGDSVTKQVPNSPGLNKSQKKNNMYKVPLRERPIKIKSISWL